MEQARNILLYYLKINRSLNMIIDNIKKYLNLNDDINQNFISIYGGYTVNILSFILSHAVLSQHTQLNVIKYLLENTNINLNIHYYYYGNKLPLIFLIQ